MRDALGPGTILGYCANVHPGRSLDEIKEQLMAHAVKVKKRVSPKEPMGMGLWFPANVAAGLAENIHEVRELRSWLDRQGLMPYTLNGFPYGDFHSENVKYDVYTPDWASTERGEYTLDLVEILHELLPEGEEGSISTLPLGWDNEVASSWPEILGQVFDHLVDLYERTGRVIHVDLEPEPGCEIMLTQGAFTALSLMDAHERDQEAFRRHIRICLDLCHQAVMFERPCELLLWARKSPFRIGKVQISSAIRVPFAGKSAAVQSQMRKELERFAEGRYLHQTTIAAEEGAQLRAFHADLPHALKAHSQPDLEWRVHYHVPVFMQEIGCLGTTQDHIIEFLRELSPEDGIKHFEVETYAWDVLPEPWRPDELADGIAREIEWVRQMYSAARSPASAGSGR